MTTPPIFNDLLFESAEAQLEFYQRLSELPTNAEKERMQNIMGKPSQFVEGLIKTFDKALLHWQRWDEWDRTEGAAWRKQMAEVQGANVEKRGRGRPRKNQADVPTPPSTAPYKRGPGRPPKDPIKGHPEYKAAFEELEAFKKQCAEWRQQQIELMDQQIATAIGPREAALEELRKRLEAG